MVLIPIFLIVIVVLFLAVREQQPAQWAKREATPEELDQIRALLKSGEETAALKAYRMVTGKSLEDAQAKIEVLSH